MITENLSTLKIHKLSQEQYDRELSDGNVDATAFYLTPDKNCVILFENENYGSEFPSNPVEGQLFIKFIEE